jgi:hypothetical protein
MIVYRESWLRADPRRLLIQLCSDLQSSNGPASHDGVVDALIAGGLLESGIADALFPEADGVDPIASHLRRAAVALGHALWHSWRGDPAELARWRTHALARLQRLQRYQLPEAIDLSTPEGYAYYAVYPESYLEAARRCYAALKPVQVVCIGLRSIGASLSAVVGAAFEELGCAVYPVTLRPRGHPFRRRPLVRDELRKFLIEKREAHFLLIDEGPGISGSSLGGSAEMLAEMDIDDSRIVLFPSHTTDGCGLRSADAREHWRRHRQFTVGFEELWIDSGRLPRDLPGFRWQDFSAGAWRRELYAEENRYPPVQPQHERRKYRLRSEDGEADRLLSFFGLGRPSAEAKFERAERLAQAGFTPRPEKILHGFLLREFVPGRQMTPDAVTHQMLDTVAGYLSHLSREHRAQPSIPDDVLREMIAVNVAEELGAEWDDRLARVLDAGESWTERPVALDGRMQAHEWIHTGSGYVKVDAFDHHDDHFFAGCQDIAWDVAGAALELAVDHQARGFLVQRYRACSGDRTITARIRHYAVAYLAFRLGYCRLAATVLGDVPDRGRFCAAADHYADLLRDELSGRLDTSWNV